MDQDRRLLADVGGGASNGHDGAAWTEATTRCGAEEVDGSGSTSIGMDWRTVDRAGGSSATTDWTIYR